MSERVYVLGQLKSRLNSALTSTAVVTCVLYVIRATRSELLTNKFYMCLMALSKFMKLKAAWQACSNNVLGRVMCGVQVKLKKSVKIAVVKLKVKFMVNLLKNMTL